MPTNKQLVLASSSPFRRSLLAQLLIEFTVIIPNIDESPQIGEMPWDLVERLSVAKAHAVLSKAPNSLIIGSDQVSVNDGVIVGKPSNRQDAINQLMAASGKTIDLFTGVALIDSDTGDTKSEVVKFSVDFRKLTLDMIDRYLIKEQPFGSCGSLQADGLGIALLNRLRGDDPTALIGLPLTVLVRMLEAADYQII
ncbi:MAG: septum formation protein Maf [Acidiferrobacteraceae bacterium]|nr:septum formation protein Maf [Acidiferrobacteraceae bacterium]